MRKKFVLCSVLFSLLVGNISASVNSTACFFDGGEKLVKEFGGLTVQNCTIIGDTNSTSGTDDGCNVSCDRAFQLGSPKEKFELSIGVGRDDSTKIIVLNITISGNTFHKLSIQYQNLASRNREIHWQTIELKEDQIPEILSVFSAVTENRRTRIKIFAEGRDYNLFKEYHFIPNSLFNNEDIQIFAYVDTTFQNKVYLHVQPHINITRYIVEFQRVISVDKKQETFFIPPAFNLSVDDLPYEQSNFPENAYYKFSLVPVDNNGNNHTAISVASFCMQTACETLIIMIVGFGAIPVLIFFSLYISYILFKKKVSVWFKGRKPSCLLVYSATHDAHINVMIKLAEYLNECGINAMIDVLDIPYEAHKNPTHWCDSAFQKANTIVVVASPECKNAIVVKTIYRSLDNHAMKLIHESRRYQNKRYLALQLPYCKESDVPKEASAFRLLQIPKDLKILVNKIHHTQYTEVYKTPDEQKLIECIESARRSILYGEPINKPNNLEKLADLIISRNNETPLDDYVKEESTEDNAAFISHESRADETEYATDIRDLDLLRDGK